MTGVNRLLKSCATPPTNWPIASNFCDCRNSSRNDSRSFSACFCALKPRSNVDRDHQPHTVSFSTIASRSRAESPVRNTSSIGFSACGMWVQSERYSLCEPQNFSPVSPGLAVRPQCSVARRLYATTTPSKMQTKAAAGSTSIRSFDLHLNCCCEVGIVANCNSGVAGCGQQHSWIADEGSPRLHRVLRDKPKINNGVRPAFRLALLRLTLLGHHPVQVVHQWRH